MFSLSVGARLYPNDVVFGEAWPIHGNPMCCVPTIEVQSSMATKDGSDSESPFLTVKASVQNKVYTEITDPENPHSLKSEKLSES